MSGPPPGLSVTLQINLLDIALLHVESTQAALRCLQCSRIHAGQVQLQLLRCLRSWRVPAHLKCEKYANCYESLSDGAQQENGSLQNTKLPLHLH